MDTKIMGILNVTPDSFSDGGRYLDASAAIRHGLAMIDDGAHIIDVGGESTRPGSTRVGTEEEQRRILPVVTELVRAGATVSVDTMSADTMEACLEAGAHIINDVSAGQVDARMLDLASQSGAEIVLMHWRGLLTDPYAKPHYDDCVSEVRTELLTRVDEALSRGVRAERIIVDPGPGFSKDADHNWELVRNVEAFTSLGYRMLWAVSRKRFIASLVSPEDPQAAHEADRDTVTAALSVLAAQRGAWAVRVHNVRASVLALSALAAGSPAAGAFSGGPSAIATEQSGRRATRESEPGRTSGECP